MFTPQQTKLFPSIIAFKAKIGRRNPTGRAWYALQDTLGLPRLEVLNEHFGSVFFAMRKLGAYEASLVGIEDSDPAFQDALLSNNSDGTSSPLEKSNVVSNSPERTSDPAKPGSTGKRDSKEATQKKKQRAAERAEQRRLKREAKQRTITLQQGEYGKHSVEKEEHGKVKKSRWNTEAVELLFYQFITKNPAWRNGTRRKYKEWVSSQSADMTTSYTTLTRPHGGLENLQEAVAQRFFAGSRLPGEKKPNA